MSPVPLAGVPLWVLVSSPPPQATSVTLAISSAANAAIRGAQRRSISVLPTLLPRDPCLCIQ
jgi:hypothetical protein